MDPASVSQKALAAWAQEMGFVYVNEDATPTKSIYAVAASTPKRRRLWEMIISSIKDRRLVKKVRNYPSNQTKIDGVKERIQDTLLEIEKVEKEMNETEGRCKLRLEAIMSYEEYEKENAKKVILAHRRKRKNSELMKSLAILRQNLTKVTQPPHSVTDSNVKEWLNQITCSMESKWCDFGLADDIKARIESDQMESIALWDVSTERVKLLTEKILLTTENVNRLRHDLMSNLPRQMNWTTYLEKQKNNSKTADDLILLMKGVVLHQKISCPNSLTEKIFSSVKECLSNMPVEPLADDLLDDLAVARLRIKADDSQSACESVETEVNELIRRNDELYNKALSSRRELVGMKKNKQDFVVNKGGNMQLQLMQLKELSKQQMRKLCDGTPNKLRDSSDEQTKSDPAPHNNDLIKTTAHHESEVSLSETLKLLGKIEDPNLYGNRGSKLMRSLTSTKNRITSVSNKVVDCRETLGLWELQPFGSTIPDSYTVSGLTYKEWKMQSSMSVAPSIRQDQSCFDFNMTQQSNFIVHRPTNPIFQYFQRTVEKAICLTCYRPIALRKGYSFARLYRHLRCHPEDYEKVMAAKQQWSEWS